MHMVEILLGTSCVLWVGLGISWFWSSRGPRVLTPEGDLPSPENIPGQWPKVSILVPARNEEEVIADCLESLLALDYPDFEIIVVDDDSSDRTGTIAEDLAARPENRVPLGVIHNRELPAGWSGKVHALSLAAGSASGEWILATDADVIYHRATLRVAMTRALAEDAALLSLGLEFDYSFFWEKVVLPAFTFFLSTVFPLRLVNSPKSSCAIAAGAFILMRARDFKALGGYERLRNTVIEDLRMAQLFKHNGRRIHFVPARGLLRTRMYTSAHELFEGLSRSAFEGAGFSPVKVLAGIVAGLLTAVLPWAAAVILGVRMILNENPGHSLELALLACALSLGIYLPLVRFLRVSPVYAFALPVAALFYTAVALNSMWRSLAGRGVPWKERYYRPPS
jgi:chlorobactene glucosyltransferase